MSSKIVPQKCRIRVSSKSVLAESCAIVSNKGVLKKCRLTVSSQGVPQVGSQENVTNKYVLCYSTYVSAFGFVGFILFFWRGYGVAILRRIGIGYFADGIFLDKSCYLPFCRVTTGPTLSPYRLKILSSLVSFYRLIHPCHFIVFWLFFVCFSIFQRFSFPNILQPRGTTYQMIRPPGVHPPP